MGIQMSSSSRIQVETALNDSAVKQPEGAGDKVSTADVRKTEAAAKVVKLDQTSGQTNAGKAGEAAGGRRAACDQYIPEKPEDTASFGHYRPVKGENGGTKIEFAKPTEETSPAGSMDKPMKDEQAAGKDGSVEVSAQKQDAAGDRVENKEDSDGQTGSDMEQISGGKNKIQELKTKKKQLERDIKAATDVRTASNLKRKLAQVEKALKAAAK